MRLQANSVAPMTSRSNHLYSTTPKLQLVSENAETPFVTHSRACSRHFLNPVSLERRSGSITARSREPRHGSSIQQRGPRDCPKSCGSITLASSASIHVNSLNQV